MYAKTAKSLAKLILAYPPEGGAYKIRPEKLHDGQLVDFHQWADNRPCEGAVLVERPDKASLWIVIVDWKKTSNYYLVLFPESRSGPLAEIHDCRDDDGELTLHWKYNPTKQDRKNPQRRAYFEAAFKSTEVCISVPTELDEMEDFFEELLSLALSRQKADTLDPSRPPIREGFPEGKLKERLHRARERNQEPIRQAKQIALARDGCLRCACCKFDFEEVYGNLGKDFIEGHHIKPVSSLHIDGELTQVEDIALVCSNCHRMLHRRRPWLGTKQLSQLLQ